MSDKFQDIYRIPSARADWWDYRKAAAYFVTICTAGREHYLGEIKDGNMQLSEMGKIAQINWTEIPNHFPFVKLDAFVMMPNHVHGILVIDHSRNNLDNVVGRDANYRVSDDRMTKNELTAGEGAQTSDAHQSDAIDQSDAINRVSTGNKYPGGITGENNPMLFDNLSRVIRWYKGRTTFQCRSIHANFAWQTRFYDHIIRDETEYWKIREYILNNPKRWDEDKYNQTNTP
jgi:putative transposase